MNKQIHVYKFTLHVALIFGISISFISCSNQSGAAYETLFDGNSFAGWEGEKTFFRIEEGAIVAGSLEEPIPKNQFLCTEKTYENFEDLPEDIKQQIDRNGNGIPDIIEEHIKETGTKRKLSIQKKNTNYTENKNMHQHTVSNTGDLSKRIMIIIFIGIALFFLYTFYKAFTQ